jgi:DNA polymerase-3 subunit beta
MFKLENVEMVTQLLRGDFPNYDQLIPESPDTVAVVDIDQLKRAVQSAGVFARDGSNIVRLEFAPLPDQADPESGKNPGRLTISASSEEVGSSTDELDVDNIDGDAAKIAFNVRYLTEAINIMDKGKVSIALNTPSTPGVMRMADNEQWTHVTMPMYVQW